MIRTRSLLLAVFATTLLSLPTPASAQLEASLNAQRFQPAPSYHSFVTTDTARLLPKMGFGLDLTFNYAWRPVQASTPDLERQTGLIDGLIGGHFRAGFAPVEWAEIDVIFPFMQISQVGSLEGVTGNRAHYSLGDLELAGRFRLLPEETLVGIAVIPFVSFPTGNRDLYATRGTFTFGARVAVSRHWKFFHFGANIGYRFVPGSGQVDTFSADDELIYGGGVGVSPIPGWLDINLELMASGIIGPARWNSAPSASKSAIHSPAELHLNGRIMTPLGLDIIVGGGPGLTSAVGTPGFRIYLGASWAPPLSTEDPVDPDPDGDGVKGAKDQCPNDPEDRDGFEDKDGCPDPDNDADGIPDASDKCPDEAEDMDGLGDEDGCPDEDFDGDGNPDTSDQCPTEVEDVDGFEDTDGCPDPDNDGDGILDADDICPDQPEDVNGVKDEDGCPDEIKAVVRKEKIVILDKVMFDVDKATIKSVSNPVLEAVQKVLTENPDIKKVRIEGHTDDTADDDYNLKLSDDRARSVMSWLIKHGIDADRIEAKGFGESSPLVANDSDENRARNRRVEFEILVQETPPPPTVEEPPAEETPAEETPAEETPAEETPAEETPAEETPAEEPPAE